MRRPDEPIPPEDFQPDPQLQLSEGRATPLQMTIVATACVAIIGLMIYGLGRNADPERSVTASAPPAAQETTGAAAPAPQTGGQTGSNVAGGDNAAAPKSDAAPQAQPAEQPAPQQTKPGAVEDDSKR